MTVETPHERANRRAEERAADGKIHVEGSIYEGMEACLTRHGHTIAHVVKYADAVELAKLGGLAYCPGILRCAKCDFRLTKTVLTPAGAFANTEPDTCPNCNVPMWLVTWKDEAHDAYKTAESQMKRALEAERALASTTSPAPVSEETGRALQAIKRLTELAQGESGPPVVTKAMLWAYLNGQRDAALTTPNPFVSEAEVEAKAFNRGVLIAASTLINCWGAGTEPAYLLKMIAADKAMVESMEFTDYDRAPLIAALAQSPEG